MKRNIIRFLLTFLLFQAMLSCSDYLDSEEKAYDSSVNALNNYLIDNNIDADPTESGLYYILLDSTENYTRQSIEENDYVLVSFVAKLIDGTVFNTSIKEVAIEQDIFSSDLIYDPFKWKVSDQIFGLVEGLQLMKEGDSAQIIIPSNLGYEAVSFNTVPSYSVLIYFIKVDKVIKDPLLYEQTIIDQYLSPFTDDIITLNSGIHIITLIDGVGKTPSEGDNIFVNYSSYLIDGRIIESNDGKSPIEIKFKEDLLIEGLYESIGQLKEGGRYKIIVPYNLAHGVDGRNEPGLKIIPPYSTLVFEISIHQVISQ